MVAVIACLRAGASVKSEPPCAGHSLLALARKEMQANSKPAAAPSDGAPSSENPALIKMSNQHTKLGPARTVGSCQLAEGHTSRTNWSAAPSCFGREQSRWLCLGGPNRYHLPS